MLFRDGCCPTEFEHLVQRLIEADCSMGFGDFLEFLRFVLGQEADRLQTAAADARIHP